MKGNVAFYKKIKMNIYCVKYFSWFPENHGNIENYYEINADNHVQAEFSILNYLYQKYPDIRFEVKTISMRQKTQSKTPGFQTEQGI